METSGREMLVEKQDPIMKSGSASVHGLVSELSEDRGTRLLQELNLLIAHLSPTQRQQLGDMLSNHSDTFALESRELGTTSIVTHVIDTGNHAPIRQPVRRTPFALRAKVDELVADVLQQEVIRPSSSPWASPIVLVRKKDSCTRFCVDYRKLNQITELNEFPLPRIDDTLDLLAGSHYFTTLDLASGYWQVTRPHGRRLPSQHSPATTSFRRCRLAWSMLQLPSSASWKWPCQRSVSCISG